MLYNPQTQVFEEHKKLNPPLMTIFEESGQYTAWPYGNLHWDGDNFIQAYTSGEGHSSADQKVMFRKWSGGLGEWGTPTVIVEDPSKQKPFTCHGGGINYNGDYLFFNRKRVGGGGIEEAYLLSKSSDKGVTWSHNQLMVDGEEYIPYLIGGLFKNKGVLMAHVCFRDNTQNIILSYDDGETWTKKVVNHPLNMRSIEGSFIAYDNTVICVIRPSLNRNQDENALITVSYDNGETWSSIYESNFEMTASPCAMLKLHDKIEIIYTSRRRGKVYRGVTSKESLIAGFLDYVEIIAEGQSGETAIDFGYVAFAENNVGLKVVNYYAGNQEKTKIYSLLWGSGDESI